MKRPHTSEKAGAAFIEMLLAPVQAHELVDDELAKLERRADREAKKRAEAEFHKQMMRTEAAHQLMMHWVSLMCAGDDVCRQRDEAKLAFFAQVQRLMQMPSPSRKCLAWKKRFAGCGTEAQANKALIEADKIRLGAA